MWAVTRRRNWNFIIEVLRSAEVLYSQRVQKKQKLPNSIGFSVFCFLSSHIDNITIPTVLRFFHLLENSSFYRGMVIYEKCRGENRRITGKKQRSEKRLFRLFLDPSSSRESKWYLILGACKCTRRATFHRWPPSSGSQEMVSWDHWRCSTWRKSVITIAFSNFKFNYFFCCPHGFKTRTKFIWGALAFLKLPSGAI